MGNSINKGSIDVKHLKLPEGPLSDSILVQVSIERSWTHESSCFEELFNCDFSKKRDGNDANLLCAISGCHCELASFVRMPPSAVLSSNLARNKERLC
jgi:hypothetical protein